MENFMDIIQSNLLEIIVALLTAIASYLGAKIKNAYEKRCNDDTKRKVVKTVVNAIEQLYDDLDGEEKLEKAEEAIVEMLNEKGISITDLEMRMLIEEVCNSFEKSLKEEK